MTNSRIVREPAPTDELPLRCLSMGSSLWARAMRLEDARLPTVLIEEARDPLPASLPERAALADSYDVLLVDAEGLSRVETGALAEWARVPVVLLCDAATDADALLQAGAWAVLPRDGVTGRWLHFALASAVRGFDRERKRRRQPLDGEEILRAVLKETGHFLAHIDLDMRYTWYLNPQFPEEAGQFMGRRIGEPMPGPEADKLRALVRYVMETGNPGHVDFHFTESPAAPGRWFDLVVRPTVDGAGEVDGALLLAMEISGYRRTGERLQQTIDRLEVAADLAQMTMLEISPDKHLLWWYGRQPAEGLTGIAGRTLDEVLAGDSLAAVTRLLEDAAAAMAPVTTILHERDEQRSTFREVTAKPQIDARGAISSYLLAVLDVTERNRLEQELRQANEDFGSIVAQTPIMLSRVDRDLRQVWALSGIRGLASDAQESSVLGAGLPAPARELIQAWAREAMETEEGLQRTLPVADEGDERVFSFSVQPMRDGGVVVGASVVGLDITGHAQMMAALSQSERRYRRLIEATTACVWHMDASLSAFREPSATWKTTTGIERPGSREEFLRAFHDDDREAIARRLEEAAASGERVQMDARLWHEPSSRHRWVQLRLMPLTQVGQGLLEWVGAALDVDDRVRARLAVTEGREELKTLLDILPAVVFIAHDSEGNRITGNQAARRLLRMPDADELSMTAAEGARPQHFRVEIGGKPAAPGDLPVQWAARQGRDWVGEEEIFFDDGAVVTLVGAARPLRGPTGSVRGAVAAFVDISVQKRLEQSLRASQVRFETFMANLPAYAWIRDASGRIVYANEQLQRDLPLFADNRLELPAEWQTLDLSARGAGSPIRASVASPEGGVDDTLLLIKFPMVEADEVLLGGIGVDITEQTRTGKALARSERRVRAIADSGNVGLWQWDGGETTLWSKTMCGFFGIPCETDEEEIALGEVSARLHPDDLERLRHAVRELTAVGHGRIEIEFRVVAPEAPLRWIALSGLLYPAGEERAAQMQGVTFDITERVQAAEALARTRQRINQIANTAKVGMWEWDGGDAVVFNRPMCELHGVLAEADEVRVPLAAAGHLVHPDDRKADAAELVRLIAAGGGDFYSEARVLVPDHAQRVVATSAKVEVNSRTGRATILGISYDVTQQWELARLREASRAELEQAVLERTQDVALASDQLRAEAAQRRTAEEQLAEIRRLLGRAQDLERVRLAHDLHDGPLQELTALSMELTLLGRRIAAGNEAASLELLDLRDRARQVALTLRAFAGDLRPPVLDSFGIAAAVQAHAEAMEERYPEVKITLEIPDEDIELEESVQTTLFRVFQQALFNVYRHAKATTVHVRLAVDDDEAALEVMDDGGGFEVPDSWISLARAGHLGIVGMAERAAAVGGRLHVESAPGRGTTVIARVPSVRPDGQEGSAPGR